MNPLHPRDQEYFDQYPEPIMRSLQDIHFTNINSTIPYFGPILYFLIRQFGCEQVLEVGHAEGYTSYYMANGVKDNAIRFGMAGNRYYGIDIVQTDKVREQLLAKDLPVTLINMDSMTLSKDTFPEIVFDLVFIDGNHDKEHILHEFTTLWPQVKGEGKGHIVLHDVYGPGEEGCQAVLDKLKIENTSVEFIRLGGMYGLLIIRKMEGYKPELWKWND